MRKEIPFVSCQIPKRKVPEFFLLFDLEKFLVCLSLYIWITLVLSALCHNKIIPLESLNLDKNFILTFL